MQFHVLTLFPDFFTSPLQSSLLGKAVEKKIVQVNLINFRDFSDDKHRKVDDAPYGGGSGMLLMAEPIIRALESLPKNNFKILLTPRGYRLRQKRLLKISQEFFQNKKDITLICGHYEGFDERVVEYCDLSLSIGDFVVSGGEIAALTLIDSLARLVDGFMGNQQSLQCESFEEDGSYIEYPQYTRPQTLLGKEVPAVLLSGNHQAIEKWRRQQSLEASQKFIFGDEFYRHGESK